MFQASYKPYTLRDYQQKFDSNGHNYSLFGGLGANRDEKWEDAFKRMMKVKGFSSVVKSKNAANFQDGTLRLFRVPAQKTLGNSRFRGLEFAKTIRRPRMANSPDAESQKDLERFIKERDEVYDRLPLYKANIKFEEEKIKMFFS